MKGYIKVDRSILDHPALQIRGRSFCEVGAFIWLLLEASFLPRKYRIGSTEIPLKRGQLCCSVSYMAKAFNWDKSKVQRWLNKLMIYDTIISEPLNDTSADIPNIITICHYDKYQDIPNDTSNNNKQNKLQRNDKIYNDEFNYIWSNLKAKKGSKLKAAKKWSYIRHKVDADQVIKKYNELVKSVSDKQFIPYFVTWLNGERWLDENTVEETKILTPDQYFRKTFGNVPDGYHMVANDWSSIEYSNGVDCLKFSLRNGKRIID